MEEEKKEEKISGGKKEISNTAITTVAVLIVGLLMVMVVFWSTSSITNELNEMKSMLSDVKEVTDMIKEYGPANNGSQANAEPQGNPEPPEPQFTPVTDVGTVDGGYIETTEETCKTDNGKLIVRLYGSSRCPHCTWEKPVLENATSLFGESVETRSYVLDTDSVSDDEVLLWQRYNPRGSVPTVIIGCKYYRIGSGERAGEESEIEAISKLICAQLGADAPDFCE